MNKSPTMPDEPFVTFLCKQCSQEMVLQERLDPGQVAVRSCPACSTSMAVHNPSLAIMLTKDLPPPLAAIVLNKLHA